VRVCKSTHVCVQALSCTCTSVCALVFVSAPLTKEVDKGDGVASTDTAPARDDGVEETLAACEGAVEDVALSVRRGVGD
jgi:hypothetical protein